MHRKKEAVTKNSYMNYDIAPICWFLQKYPSTYRTVKQLVVIPAICTCICTNLRHGLSKFDFHFKTISGSLSSKQLLSTEQYFIDVL